MNKIIPWDKIGKPSILAENYGKSFVIQKFLDPKSNKEYDFSLFGQPDWSVIFPLTESGEVVAVEQYKQGCNRIVLELPAGTGEKDESPEDCVKRELLEETGYSPARIVPLDPPQFMSTRNSWTRFHMYLGHDCKKVKAPSLDHNEELSTRLFSLGEWLDICVQEVVEPSAIVTTLKALYHLGFSIKKS
jgi:8-oxo-dGTP pyrophosphatase MutT (NUDIX family)